MLPGIPPSVPGVTVFWSLIRLGVAYCFDAAAVRGDVSASEDETTASGASLTLFNGFIPAGCLGGLRLSRAVMKAAVD